MTVTDITPATDGATIKKRELYGHLPEEGDVLYVWVRETHPEFEKVRDDLYGFATSRGVLPDGVWSGIVPAAIIPWKFKSALEENYIMVWVTEREWRRRCVNKIELRSVRKDLRRKNK